MSEYGVTQKGQQFDAKEGIVKRFTETMLDRETADAKDGQARTEITPHDSKSALARVYGDLTAIYLAVAPVMFDTYINLPKDMLPNVLTGVAVTFNSTEVAGNDVQDAPFYHHESTTGGLSVTLTASASAQGSASVMPDIQPVIREMPTRVKVKNVLFYLPASHTEQDVLNAVAAAYRVSNVVVAGDALAGGIAVCATPHGLSIGQRFTFTAATAYSGFTVGTVYYVLTKPTSSRITFSATSGGTAITATAATFSLQPVVESWPVMFPIGHTVTLKGQQISVRQSAQSRESIQISQTEYALERSPDAGKRSDGYSKESGSTISSKFIPPTIHGTITFSATALTKAAATIVKANLPEIGYNGTNTTPYILSLLGVLPAITNEPAPIAEPVTGSISPASLPATTPAAIPSVDLYLVDLNQQFVDADNAYISASILDATVFA